LAYGSSTNSSSRPGSWTGTTSKTTGSRRCHGRYVPAPAPANGKHISLVDMVAFLRRTGPGDPGGGRVDVVGGEDRRTGRPVQDPAHQGGGHLLGRRRGVRRRGAPW